MQYVEGDTLAHRIRKGSLNLSECLAVATQVADALAEAHSRGIIHRDISPANIMLTARHQAMVMDFGLAKLVRDSSLVNSEALTESLPVPEMLVGTILYMSPEQVRGESVDARSDIFSFGAVLYEMITGHLAFAAENMALTIGAIVGKDPDPLPRYCRYVPSELQRIVSKALQKDREQRYQTAQDLLVDLRAFKHHVDLDKETPEWQGPIAFATRDNGQPTPHIMANGRATSGAVTLIQEPRKTRRLVKGNLTAVITAAAILVLAGTLIVRYNFLVIDKPFHRVAVLPLQNVTNDPESEYLSDGIAESLINSLSELPELTVVARTTAFRYKGKEIDPQQVGRELQVQAIVTGRLIHRDDALTIQVDLVETEKGSQIWGRRYDRKLSDLLTVKQDLTTDITERLRLVGNGDEKRLVKGETSNTDALQFYLRGLYFWNKRTAEDLKKAIIEFQHAIDRDPHYALAYVGLADSYTLLEPFAGEPGNSLISQARAAVDRALQLDEDG